MSNYHLPVMLPQCLQALQINPSGTYVDVTFGGGGHSKAILAQLGLSGRLIAFDQDPDAWKNAPNDDRFTLVQHNFRYLKRFLRYHEALPVDGILADLGISSHQIDAPERGFAHRFEADLDMRMSKTEGFSARDFLNQADEKELKRVFKEYGEVDKPGLLASKLIAYRSQEPIQSTHQLKSVLESMAKKGQENKFSSQVFQAIRIHINDELSALQNMLLQTAEVLKPGGRLVIMSYHSLEDRLVKHYLNSGNFEGKEQKDFYGNRIRPYDPDGRAVHATEEEISGNSRARSAVLRVGVKR